MEDEAPENTREAYGIIGHHYYVCHAEISFVLPLLIHPPPPRAPIYIIHVVSWQFLQNGSRFFISKRDFGRKWFSIPNRWTSRNLQTTHDQQWISLQSISEDASHGTGRDRGAKFASIDGLLLPGEAALLSISLNIWRDRHSSQKQQPYRGACATWATRILAQ